MSSPTLLESRAAQLLQQSSHPALRKLEVEETDGSVVLSGRVSSYYLKQLAQETVMPARGRKQLLNRIVVERA